MRILLIATFIFASTQLFSQEVDKFDQTNNNIGLTLRGSFGTEGSNSVGSIGLRYGRFVANRLNLGASASYTRIGQFGQAMEYGPFLRYYFTADKFAPLAELHVVRGTITNRAYAGLINNSWLRSSVGAGFAWTSLSSPWGAEILTEYYQLRYNSTAFHNVILVGRLQFFF